MFRQKLVLNAIFKHFNIQNILNIKILSNNTAFRTVKLKFHDHPKLIFILTERNAGEIQRQEMDIQEIFPKSGISPYLLKNQFLGVSTVSSKNTKKYGEIVKFSN